MKKLTIIEGTMFAGKTSRLIDIIQQRSQEVPCLVFKPALDTRSSIGCLTTHDGRTFPAISVPDSDSVLDTVQLAQQSSPWITEAVFIDEIQFFEEDIIPVVKTLLETVDVYLAGLEKDYKSQMFGHVHKLKYLASELVFLRATCTKCAEPADYNCRMTVKTTEQIQVGGKEDYEPRCQKHVFPSNPARV